MKRVIVFVLLMCMSVTAFSSCTTLENTPTGEVTGDEPCLTDTYPFDTMTSDTLMPSTPTPDAKNKTFVASTTYKFMYKNMYFYPKSTGEIVDGDFVFRATIKYQNMDNVTEEGYDVFPEWCDSENNAFMRNGVKNITSIAVDIDATNQNGGVPVLAFTCLVNGKSCQYLAFYNMKDDSMTFIEDETRESSISSFYLYGDTVYYPTYTTGKTGGKTHKMRSMKKDGTNPVEYSAEFGNVKPTFGFYNDKVYYYTDTVSDPYLRVADINFENREKLIKLWNPAHYPKINDGYVYYTESSRTTLVEGKACGLCNIYRRSLDDFDNSSPELMVENVYNYFMGGSKIVYWTDYDVIKIQGAHFDYFEPYVLRCFDTLPEESKTLITAPKNEDSVLIVYRAYNDYVLFYAGITKEDKDQQHYSINLNTGKIRDFIK